MEQMHKSSATESSRAQGACADSMVDRFSSVPCEVAYRILSLVSFKDLTRVGSMSKRCREFYLSTPSLKFPSSYESKQQKMNLLNCIDRYMICRRDDKIKSFCINWSFPAGTSQDSLQVMNWVLIAVRCNVEALDLQLGLNERDGVTFELPSCIYCCEPLRLMSINTGTILKAPSFACSNNLQCLKLTRVRIDDGFGNWVSCSCKCIKELLLDYVDVGGFTIESSSLESFTLLYTYNSEPCQFSISGDNLAEINIDWEISEASSSVTRSLKRLGDDDYDFDNAFEVLRSFCRAKSLVLSEETIKVFLREGSMHAPLDGTAYLGMHIMSLNDDLVPAMVSLLRGMPNLKTLYINLYPAFNILKPKASGFKRKYRKSQNLDCVYQLKNVSIALSTGYPNNALELAIYIFLSMLRN